MRCSKCGTESTSGKKFCAACGTALSNRCPKCGADNALASAFCEDCGGPLAAIAAPAALGSARAEPAAENIRITPETDSSPALDGERKTVTALFADIKGSMELMEDLDPEEARAIVDPALKLMMDEVHRYDGYIVQSTGDGIFALFGAPVAHEDHPQRALYAALRMQEQLRGYSSKLVAEGGTPLEARVGVNTGEVVVRPILTGAGHVEYTPIGHTANLASRMQTVAPTGSIAIAGSTQKLVEGYFELKSLGPTRVKGVTEPVNVYQVIGLGPLRTRLQRSAGRGLTKFVGREHEMQAMKRAAEQAKAGRGQIVAAMAEAGVGKSLLMFEFKATSAAGWMVLEASSVSHGKASSYLPVIDLLHSYFKITSHDDQRTRREKIAGRIAILDRTLEETLPYLYSLLGIAAEPDPLAQMDPQVRKRGTHDAIKRVLLRESLNQPLMVIFEDLHWIDEGTQGLLDLLADSIGTAKLLLLVNYRPEYSHRWNSKTYYTQLRLDPLGKESADELLSVLLGAGVEVAALKRLIIERTGGNPFFMEETVLVLFDEGALVRNGAVKLTRPLNQLKIPPTVQAILAARIDRLAPDHKDLVQTLAVIGTEFQLSLVRRVAAKSGPELEPMLSELQLSEFIYEQPAFGDLEYTFKHALTHEVAYNSVLKERRRLLHERIGVALESIYADSLDDHVAELAHHYARSGNPGKAVEYCLRAVQQCVDRASYAEAVAQFESGLEQLGKLPDDDRRAELELDLRNAVLLALSTIKGFNSPEAEQSSVRVTELRQRLTINFEQTYVALVGVLLVHLFRPDVRKACEVAAEMVARAEEQGSAEYIAEATSLLAFVRMLSGEFDLAAQDCERGWALLESGSKPPTGLTEQHAGLTPLPTWQRLYIKARIRDVSAMILALLGYPDRAVEHLSIATAIARESGLKMVEAEVHSCGCTVYGLRSEPGPMRERAEALLECATETGNPLYSPMSGIFLGLADALEGDPGGGIARMRRHLSEQRATGSEVAAPNYLVIIAMFLGQMGQCDEGLRTIDESFSIMERTGEFITEAEAHRIKGELLLAQDPSNAAQAEQSFRTAIEISRKQKAKSLELRATTNLARMLDRQGNRAEARAMLADIYNWFTEGFDTADLKDAKALLDELSG
jgi:class 3 adenylate cyclase/tetratricopeptide (TPR) repeat protein